MAVLPFHVPARSKLAVRFAEGIEDEMLTSLARNKQLMVISAGSASNPRLNEMTPAAKGEALGVSLLIEESVQRTGTKYRVNGRVFEASTGRTLYARVFEGDGVSLQRQVAQEFTSQLQPARPEQAAPGVPTENMAAYEAYLGGREWERRPENEMSTNALKAAECYERAASLDPTFTLAQARAASAYARVYWKTDDWNMRPVYREKAQRAVEQAIKINPRLAEAHAALGDYYFYCHRDYDHALKELQLAQKELPNDSEVALDLGLVLRRKAAWEESLANLARASQLDPLNARYLGTLADTYDGLRGYEVAERILARQMALSPNDPELRIAQGYLSFKKTGNTAKLREATNLNDPANEPDDSAFARWDVNMLERKFDDAIAQARQSALTKVETEFAIFPKDLLFALAYWAKGDQQAALPYFEKAKVFMEPVVQKNTEGPRLRVALAMAYAGLRRKSEAIEQARLAVDERSPQIDPVAGPPIAVSAARVYAMVGEKEAAVRQLQSLIKMPFGLSLSRAKIDPTSDPLRGLPEFEQLLK